MVLARDSFEGIAGLRGFDTFAGVLTFAALTRDLDGDLAEVLTGALTDFFGATFFFGLGMGLWTTPDLVTKQQRNQK